MSLPAESSPLARAPWHAQACLRHWCDRQGRPRAGRDGKTRAILAVLRALAVGDA